MNSNMKYRQYLTNNAESIMKNNLMNANINCSTNFLQIDSINQSSTPFLFKSIIEPSLIDNSNLKKNYLDNLIELAKMFTPGIMYYK